MLFCRLILLFVIGFFSVESRGNDAEGNDAGLKWQVDSVDLHPIVSGTQVSVLFNYKNFQDTDIEVTAVKASCGCMIVKMQKKLIKPGESGFVAALVNISGMKGMNSKEIIVKTNKGAKVLKIKITVPESAWLSPDILNWSIDGLPTTKIARIKSSGKSFKIGHVISSGNIFSFKVIETIPDKEHSIEITPISTEKIAREIISCEVLFSDQQKQIFSVIANIK